MINFKPRIRAASAAALAFFTAAASPQAETPIEADIWADNWFALYVDGKLVMEDSVPFATERSFNADSFAFSAVLPAQAAVIMKDYYEDDSGLEYIGERRQQMGDGGFIAQFHDAASGELLSTSSRLWRCKAIHQAPLNRSCERSDNPSAACESLISDPPAGWMSADFDDREWQPAIEHGARAIRPHGEYDRIAWAASARLIWSEDLEVDNTVLCRFTLAEP